MQTFKCGQEAFLNDKANDALAGNPKIVPSKVLLKTQVAFFRLLQLDIHTLLFTELKYLRLKIENFAKNFAYCFQIRWRAEVVSC